MEKIDLSRVPFKDLPNSLEFGKIYKYLDQCAHNETGDYYNIRPLLTYNKPMIFLTGGRDIGKTTTVAEVPLLNYLVYGRKFYFVKQKQEELVSAALKFFHGPVNVINKYTEGLPEILGVEYNRKIFYIATERKGEKLVWQPFGEVKALENETTLKGLDNSGASNLVIFDEFINDSANSYLGGSSSDLEWVRLTRLISSIDREEGKPVKNGVLTICCSNKMTTYCPILIGAGVIPYANNTVGSIINPKYEGWVWEDSDMTEVGNSNIQLSFASYLTKHNQAEHAVMFHNESSDDLSFIKKPEAASYITTFRFKGIEYGVYVDKESFYYIWKPQKGSRIIALDSINKNEDDFQLLQSWREDYTMQRVVEMYKRNRLYFGNAQIKNAIMNYLKFIP